MDPGDASIFLWKIDDFISHGIVRATQQKDFKQVSALSWLANCLEAARKLCGVPPPNVELHWRDKETKCVKKPIIVTFLMVVVISFFGFVTLQKLGNVVLHRISNQTGLEMERIWVQFSPYLVLAPAMVFAFLLLLMVTPRSIRSKLKLFRFWN